MKIGGFGDLHVTNKSPELRTDDYWETLNGKIDFILDTFKDLDAVVQPGDFFDTHKATYYVVQHMISKLQEIKVPFLTVFGQHDMRYHNSNIENTPLKVLESARSIQLLNENPLTELWGSVHFYGAGWNQPIPKILATNVCNILVTHRLVLPKDIFMGKNTNYELANILLETNEFDLIVSGDNHQFFYTVKGEQALVNCGSVMRARSDQEHHKPSIFIYDTNTKELEMIEIPIKPFNEVMNIEEVKKEKEVDAEMKEFMDEINKDDDIEGIEFKKNMYNYLKTNTKKIAPKTIDFVVEVMDGIN